jgi:hypothetical protein
MATKIKWLDSWTCYFLNSDTEKQFASKEEAVSAAEAYAGNNRHTILWHGSIEESFLFGPGDGTTSVMVRHDCEFVDAD